MKVLVTGANGFIGKNLLLRLGELSDVNHVALHRSDPESMLSEAVASVDAVIHLAGENRPESAAAFEVVNAGLTRALCAAIARAGNRCPVILASSIQADLDNPYGRSKLAAESAVEELALSHGNPVVIYRLPGVFGKWCRPDYNSVVATFCHRIANDLPITIRDPSYAMRLVYIDDVLTSFIEQLREPGIGISRPRVEPEYVTTLGELAGCIQAFRNCRTSLISERVGTGLVRALYATYVSCLPKEKFTYEVPAYRDTRGVFVEMLKTPDAGQFSYFTARPGVTRGSHYHHTKTEKFLVISGRAQFGFRHMVSGEVYQVVTSGETPEIVETVPGWAHDITNIGDTELIVMLWANENFDRSRPDTIAGKV